MESRQGNLWWEFPLPDISFQGHLGNDKQYSNLLLMSLITSCFIIYFEQRKTGGFIKI